MVSYLTTAIVQKLIIINLTFHIPQKYGKYKFKLTRESTVYAVIKENRKEMEEKNCIDYADCVATFTVPPYKFTRHL